jgi:hypothetical protein
MSCSSGTKWSPDIPIAWPEDACLDQNGAKFPLSSYRHAIKYTPGAAKVEKNHRIESKSATEILLGISSQCGSGERLISLLSLLSRGVSSLAELSS